MALTKVSAAMFSTAAQTSDLNLDDGTLFVDSSENKVAIGNTAPAEALDITGNMTLRSRGYVKLQDDSGGQFVALRAPATVSSNVTWSLPPADGSSGQSLVTDGSGALSWQTNYLSVSAGTGVTVSSNTISIGQAVATSDSPTFTNLTLSGNLTVNGSTVTNSATNTTIEDLLIELGTGTSGTPSSDAGIVIERGSSDNVFLGWDESADAVVFGTGSFTGASSGNLTITPATIHVAGVGIGTTSPDVSLDIGSKTDAVHVPVGTTGQRPGSPAAGYFRYNSTTNQFEGYTTAWGAIGGGSTTLNTDTFTGNGSTVDFTISQPISSVNNLIVFIDGVYQNPDAYSLPANTTLRFSAAPANSRKIAVYSVAGVVQGTNLNIDSFTGDGSDLTFTLSITPVSENNTLVYVGGVYQQKSVYSVSGTTLTFGSGNAPPNGASIEVATFNQTNINVPVDNTITTAKIVNDAVTADKIVDNIALPGNITTTGTLAPTGVLTANAGVVVDNITINGAQIDLSSGDLFIDVAGDIVLDADGGDIFFDDGGTRFGKIYKSSDSLHIWSAISDGDIRLQGNDGGSTITALTLDMSDAGKATFNAGATFGDSVNISHGTPVLTLTDTSSSATTTITLDGVTTTIDSNGTDGDIIFKGQDASSEITALTLDMSDAGKATFNSGIVSTGGLFRAASSGATADASADDLVVENSANAGISILSGASNTGSIYFGDSGTNWDGYIAYSQNDRQMTLGTAAGARMIIKSDGKVGIGTTSPSGQLVVAASNGGNGIETQVTSHATNKQFILAYDRANSAYLNMEISALNFGIATNNGTTRMHIDSAGKVGIGTTSPGGLPLHLKVSSGDNKIRQQTANKDAFTMELKDATGDLHLGTNTTAGAIQITDAGRVTMPSQPFFQAHNGDGGSWQDVTVEGQWNTGVHNADTDFWTDGTDRGGNFDSSTGRFTAPVSGWYQFNVSLYVRNTSSSTGVYVHPQFMRNGVLGFNSGSGSAYNIVAARANSGSEYLDVRVTQNIYCSATQYVEFKIYWSATSSGTWDHYPQYAAFSGGLIS